MKAQSRKALAFSLPVPSWIVAKVRAELPVGCGRDAIAKLLRVTFRDWCGREPSGTDWIAVTKRYFPATGNQAPHKTRGGARSKYRKPLAVLS